MIRARCTKQGKPDSGGFHLEQVDKKIAPPPTRVGWERGRVQRGSACKMTSSYMHLIKSNAWNTRSLERTTVVSQNESTT